MVDQLARECPKETFDAGVVPTVAFVTHTGDAAMLRESPLVAHGGILTAAIRMVHEPCHGNSVDQGHVESLLGHLTRYAGAHRPADDPACIQIE